MTALIKPIICAMWFSLRCLALPRMPSFHPSNSSSSYKFPILHSHRVSTTVQLSTASASLSTRIKGISNERVSPGLGKRPPLPTGSGSDLVVLGLWSSTERFGEIGIHM